MFSNEAKRKNIRAKKNRKRKKKSNHQGDKKVKFSGINNLDLAKAMSSWADTYTTAATWQLKHELAYWKARTKALEYENSVLHEAIRKNYLRNRATTSASSVDVESDESSASDDEEAGHDYEDVQEEVEEEEVEDEDDLEVSEEFIEFLRKNAKFKEELKREKERSKALLEAEQEKNLMEELKFESAEERSIRFIEMYGENCDKIMALETFTLCNFINECDKTKPKHWPIIPFNFGAA